MMLSLIEKLSTQHTLTADELLFLLKNRTPEYAAVLSEKARKASVYKNEIYIRGLIEISNHCKNDCFYCGIRKSNPEVCRYRLTEDEILNSCYSAYALGFRTFVLQGGEDGYFTPEKTKAIIKKIKAIFPDTAVTLSLGEQTEETYALWKKAGADRYLLRHETADNDHYRLLHPERLTLENRMRCLQTLKKLGYQVGCGFMVGSPFQTLEHIVKDLLFIKEFNPDMVGIGPFIPAENTPFKNENAGSVELTLYLLSIIRLMLPDCLIPATTALATKDKNGLIKGFLAGANVCMPNISPDTAKLNYTLYEGKKYTDGPLNDSLEILKKQTEEIGFNIVIDKGDKKNGNL